MRVDITTDKCGQTYPWVGRGKHIGHIVLFTAPNVGTIIHTDEPNGQHVVGYHTTNWREQSFIAVCITLDSTVSR